MMTRYPPEIRHTYVVIDGTSSTISSHGSGERGVSVTLLQYAIVSCRAVTRLGAVNPVSPISDVSGSNCGIVKSHCVGLCHKGRLTYSFPPNGVPDCKWEFCLADSDKSARRLVLLDSDSIKPQHTHPHEALCI